MDKPHFYRVGPKSHGYDDTSEFEAREVYKDIEPWLSAVFQSEHLSLLVGNGLPTAISLTADSKPCDMSVPEFECELNDEINKFAEKTAEAIGRGEPNFEDKIRVASQLVMGLKILGDDRADNVIKSLDKALTGFVNSVLETEQGIIEAIEDESEAGIHAKELLVSFLLSFASRSATRERLHIFTTNYDRLIEYGCDIVGLRPIDRFIGGLSPIFRSSRVEVDLHYNPPGIRGEPRYLEGVIRFTKLHGSIDWIFQDGKVRRYAIPFGANTDHPDLPDNPYNEVMIYPNPAKDVETLEYPYAELFRDFASALCRPNSVLVTYGYGFGDDHINRVITDMLTIPSTHLVIISYDIASGRIPRFCKQAGHEAQISLLIGNHFGNLHNLTEYYLPKPAIDQITWRQTELLKRRVYRPELTEGEE
jgi:hypothetical protein